MQLCLSKLGFGLANPEPTDYVISGFLLLEYSRARGAGFYQLLPRIASLGGKKDEYHPYLPAWRTEGSGMGREGACGQSCSGAHPCILHALIGQPFWCPGVWAARSQVNHSVNTIVQTIHPRGLCPLHMERGRESTPECPRHVNPVWVRSAGPCRCAAATTAKVDIPIPCTIPPSTPLSPPSRPDYWMDDLRPHRKAHSVYESIRMVSHMDQQ